MLCATVIFLGLSHVNALAIPVFANGQGVSCETCHTTFPGMTRYGMTVMMSNFQVLNEHLQNKALPLSVRMYITSQLGNKDRPGATEFTDLSLLGGGFLGRNFTWYGEQHVIDSGQPGQTEQLWVSWNGLLRGLNSIQVGKFHTPFPFMPAHAWSLSSYLLATQTTGQNVFNPNDARWGAAFNGMSNEFMYNLSYLTGSGPTGDALDFNRASSARTLDLNVSYGGMSVPWSVGVVAMRGDAPLLDAAGNAQATSDAFTREGAYFGYQNSLWHFQTMYYHGFDAHPDLTEYNVPLNGYFVEAERDFGWHDHALVRYDVASSDTLARQYVLDLAHNVLPNLALVGELAMGPNQRPQVALRVAVAGPYESGKRFVRNGLLGVRIVPASQTEVAQRESAATASAPVAASAGPQAPASARPMPPAASVAATPSAGAGDANAGAALVAKNSCQGCHGAQFEGGIGPKLVGIEKHLSSAQIADFIRHPRPPMPDFGFTDAQIGDIVAYLSNLDGGAAGSGPVVTFAPSPPGIHSTITVRFPSEAAHQVSASALMIMGAMKMPVVPIDMKPTLDPHVWTGTVTFSMGGPWTITILYDGKHVDVPVMVGG